MKLNERQMNAAIRAIIIEHFPNFNSFPIEQKSSIGRSTWWWFSKVVDQLPEKMSPELIFTDYSESVKEGAVLFIIGVIRSENIEAQQYSDEFIKSRIRTEDLDSQSGLFMKLSEIGIRAAQDSLELMEMAANFDEIDLDRELKELIAREG